MNASFWKTSLVSCLAIGAMHAGDVRGVSAGRRLEVVAEFPHQQVTGVAVSKLGRVFVNFPYWGDGHTVSVLEIEPSGARKFFPDAAWNLKTSVPTERFVCVQSVHIDDLDDLWIVDAGSPKQTGVIPGGAKLLKVDLTADRVVQVITFDDTIVPKESYLNDVRVDTRRGFAFLTDSNLGALIVVNLKTGTSRRVLSQHASVKPEVGIRTKVEGIALFDPEKEKPAAIGSDGIALDADGGFLYYKALTGRRLYRIPLVDIEDERLMDDALVQRLENVGSVPVSDGLEFRDGRVYITAIEDNAVTVYDVLRKRMETVVQDERLKWPDSLAFGPHGSLYVTTSQIHLTPRFNQGAYRVKEPYRLYRMTAATVADAH